MVLSCNKRRLIEEEEREKTREPDYERMKVPFHYTTSTITARRDEDRQFIHAFLHLSQYAVILGSTT